MVDLVVLVFLVLALLGGWHQGFIASMSASAGWLVGVVVGIWATPRLLDVLDSRPETELNTLLITLGCALILGMIGAGLLGHLGQAVADRAPHERARDLDAWLGAVAMGVVALLVVWAGLSSARPMLSDDATRQIRKARIWGTVDKVLPDPARDAIASLNKRFAESPFPEAFSGSAPQVDVAPPDGTAARSPAVTRARPSVVKVTSHSDRCAGTSVGSGWVVSSKRIVTNAHVVAGGHDVSVQPGGTGPPLAASVVGYDDELDLAILRVPDLDAPALPRTDKPHRGTPVAAAGFPRGGDYSVTKGRVRRKAMATGRDVYDRKPVNRGLYLVRTKIAMGNSGGPLLTADGHVAGTVFAKSAINDNTAYVLTDHATEDWLDAAPSLTKSVPTGDCAPHDSI